LVASLKLVGRRPRRGRQASRPRSQGSAGSFASGRWRRAQRERAASRTSAEARGSQRQGPQRRHGTHWSRRRLAAKLGVSQMTIARLWRKHGLRSHRLHRYMAPNDPDFEKKTAEIIGLYVNPPVHAAVFCVDEKTAIQALDRKDPVLPLSPGRAERHGFEYRRHGTVSLHAAFNTDTGEVVGETAPRHTSEEFVAFLGELVAHHPKGQEIPSSWTTSPRTRPPRWPSSSTLIPTSTCASRQPTRPGLIRSNSGSGRSNAMSSPGACSRPAPTCDES